MDGGRVLVLDLAEAGIEGFEATLDDEVEVATLAALSDVMSVLTKTVVDCLVVPPDVDVDDAVRIVNGVQGLFPALPIVVAADSPLEDESQLEATVVRADAIQDDAVVSAVRSALAEADDSAAARPPSRMETILLSMLDRLPLHLFAKDDAGRHLLTSNAELSPAEMIGLTDLDFTEFSREFRNAAYTDDMHVIEGDGRRVEVEEYAGYVESHTLTSKAPWYDEDGEIRGLVGVTRDITEQKQREQATRRQHELLVKVALVAAHELRNELQVAAGRLELIEEDDDQLAVIEGSQRRLANIVDKVVELASEERPRHDPTGLWLSTLSREVWKTLDPATGSLDIVEDVHFTADRESASLFLQTLFKNAVDHGGEDVTVTVGAIDEGFYVADDGTGIDVDPAERVFDAGYTTDPDSTGFGLYVARSIADEHGWTIELSESADGGARFDVVGPTLEDSPGAKD